ncbi:MAG: hypothetical protein Q4C47_05965, partial [Planctomycetia bacterium]|nr:hypothetical protein [Planctomycetia bacterium]
MRIVRQCVVTLCFLTGVLLWTGITPAQETALSDSSDSVATEAESVTESPGTVAGEPDGEPGGVRSSSSTTVAESVVVADPAMVTESVMESTAEST